MTDNYRIPSTNPLQVRDAIETLLLFTGLPAQGVTVGNAQNNPYVIGSGSLQDVPEANFISQLGTVVYSNFILNGGTDPKTGFTWQDFRVDDALFIVSQSKRIVETEIQGRDGSVTEYIGLSDFNIQITGRITGGYNQYKKEEVATLKRILDLGQPLAITAWYLQNLDITDITIRDYDFGQSEGEYSTQYFTIMAKSDRVVEALITNQ